MTGPKSQTLVAMVMLMLRSLLLLFLCIEDAYPLESVYAPLGGTVTMLFVIPDRYRKLNQNVLVGQIYFHQFHSIITYRAGGPQWSVVEKYKQRIKYAVFNANIEITLSSLESRDRGTYLCHDENAKPLEGCEQFLVVLGRPFRPIIHATQAAVEGQPLNLSCHHHTTLSEPDLPSGFNVISWDYKNLKTRDSKGVEKGELGEANATLFFPSVKRTYKDTVITCRTQDIFPKYTGPDPLPVSNSSLYYHFNPEFAPKSEDIIISPSTTTPIDRLESEIIKYKCEVHCEPPCTVYWAFKGDSDTSFTNLTMKDSHILRKRIDKVSQGIYRCTGANKHGEASWELNVKVTLLEDLEIQINGIEEVPEVFLEHIPLTLTCSTATRTEKSPVISWKSNGEVLMSDANIAPKYSINKEGHHNYKYTAAYTKQTTNCGSPLDYTCVVDHNGILYERSLHVEINCPPSVYQDDDSLKLMPEYETSPSDALEFAFVVRGYPEPMLTKVTSSLNGIERLEDLDKDISVKKEKVRDKNNLTKFTFATLRQLTSEDRGRNYTMHFKAGDFTEVFSFIVKTPHTEPPAQETTTKGAAFMNDTGHASRHPRIDDPDHDTSTPELIDPKLFMIISSAIFVVVAVGAVTVILKLKKQEGRDSEFLSEDDNKELKGASRTSQRASQKASEPALSPVSAGESKIS